MVGGHRVVLTWSALPKDLDLVVETSSGDKVNYRNRKTRDEAISLDVDARDGYGPETITISNVTDDKLYIYANNYSQEIPFNKSKARAVVVHGSKVIATLDVPTEDQDVSNNNWFIGTLTKNGVFTPVNKIVADIPRD